MCKYEGCEGCTPDCCPRTKYCKPYDRARNHDRGPEYKENRQKWLQETRNERLEQMRRYNEEHPRLDYWKKRHEEVYTPIGDLKIYMGEDGSILYMRSMSEVYFAHMLDDEGICWRYESRHFNTDFGVYTPDFYISNWDAYVEVKASRWMEKSPEQQMKREWLRNSGIKIYLVDSDMIDAAWW